ncbi:MAG: hypothetical protein QXX08_02285, partial [Candidatus Bathyarchaeia archaeon]
STEDLQSAPINRLVELPLIGPKIAKKIKEQVGGFVKSKEWKELSEAKKSEQQPLTDYTG